MLYDIFANKKGVIDMKIITFSAAKGGVGKTTICYNLAEWLVSQGKNVLLIDSDHQVSLTSLYSAGNQEDNLYTIFSTGKGSIQPIKENLSIIPSSPILDNLEGELVGRANASFIMMMWMQEHVEDLKNFDYVLIDTHPDFLTVTRNMIAISHYVINPLDPGEFSFKNIHNYTERMNKFKAEAVEPISRKPYVDASVIFVPNRIRPNTHSSREFLDVLGKNTDIDVSLSIPEREIFNKSTLEHKSVFELLAKKNNAKSLQLKEQLEEIFEKLANKVSE
ncbi:ParA family protein [Pediococcus pentosaceus]|nr:ParA family protein [Pediococcus pentosaceus]